ncbi:MAG: hypothetical protein H7144_13770, partial [Burkholderiales bacterium]|nr:hypothetical protein [Phycisphaerae bacterium]
MRSLILVLVVLGALVGVFAAFMLMQDDAQAPAPRAQSGSAGSATTRPTASGIAPPPSTQTATNSVVGGGEDVWIQQFEKDTARLVSEFRAAKYDPPKEGIVFVVQPESRMYSSNGQVMALSAQDGEVVLPEQARKSDRLDDFSSGPPTRGVLNNVTISLFENADATVPTLTCTVPRVTFDNDANRLNTVQTEINGQVIPADRIPVTVRGREYDFDGQGLVMRWNQRDQRLELLEIAHGERLVVKNPGAFGAMPLTKASATRTFVTEEPVQLVSADEADAAAVAAQNREIKRRRAAATQQAAQKAAEQAGMPPREAVAYVATFHDNVTITQGGVPVGSAEKMLARFTFDGGDPAG